MTANWTPEDLAIVQERIKLNMGEPTVDPLSGEDLESADPGPESELQKKITAHARDNGWPHISFPRTEKVRRFLPPGWPDVFMAIPQGRAIFLELKAAKKELREKQRLMASMLKMLGHEVYQVKSFKKYLKIVEPKPQNLHGNLEGER